MCNLAIVDWPPIAEQTFPTPANWKSQSTGNFRKRQVVSFPSFVFRKCKIGESI